MELRNQSVQGFVWSVVEKFGNRIFTFLIFFTLATLLSPKVFGVVAIVNSVLAFVVIFVDQGFTTAVVQKDNPTQEYLDTAFWGNMAISVVLTLILYVCAPLLATLYEEPELTLYIRVISASFIIGAISRVQNALFIKEMKFRLLAIRRLIATLTGGLTGIYLAVMDFGVWSLICYQMASMLTMTIVLSIQSRWRPKWNFSLPAYKELLGYGVNVLGNNLLFYSQLHLVNLLIGYFLGTTSLGYYSIANKVFVTFKDIVINTFSRISLPLFAKIQHEERRRNSVFHEIVAKVLLLIIPICIGLVFLFPDIVPLFLGPTWIPSIPLVQILFLACALTVIPSFCNDFFLGVGLPKLSFRMNLANASIYLTLVLIGTQLGLIETTIGVTVSFFLAIPISLLFLRTAMPIQWGSLLRIHGQAFLIGLFIAAGMFGINTLITEISFVRAAIKGCMLVIIYIAALSVIYPPFYKEIKSYFLTAYRTTLQFVSKQ